MTQGLSVRQGCVRSRVVAVVSLAAALVFWAVCILLPAPCLAVPISGQGTWESTLEGRDLDGDVSTFEAYFDSALNITWLADANYAQTSGFDADGKMIWGQAKSWAANLSVNGFTGWRLPTLSPIDGISFQETFTSDGSSDRGTSSTTTDGTDGGWRDAAGNPVSELGNMFYVTLGNTGACDPTLPYCTNQTGAGLSNTGLFLNISGFHYWLDEAHTRGDTAWLFRNDIGRSNFLIKNFEFPAWAVRDGDVLPIPEPSTALLLALGITGLAASRRQRRLAA